MLRGVDRPGPDYPAKTNESVGRGRPYKERERERNEGGYTRPGFSSDLRQRTRGDRRERKLNESLQFRS